MAKLTIIQDGAKLSTMIGTVLKLYTQTFEKLHIVVISAIWHACKNGDPVYLNRIFAALNANDQQAVKLFIRRAHAINGLKIDGAKELVPDGLTSEVINQSILQGTVFGFSKGSFSVVNGHTTSQAKTLLKLCEDRFLNPDGKLDQPVFARNNFAEVKTLGDEEILTKMIKLAKEAETDTETRKSKVTDSTKKFLAGLRDQLELRKQQLSLAEG